MERRERGGRQGRGECREGGVEGEGVERRERRVSGGRQGRGECREGGVEGEGGVKDGRG